MNRYEILTNPPQEDYKCPGIKVNVTTKSPLTPYGEALEHQFQAYQEIAEYNYRLELDRIDHDYRSRIMEAQFGELSDWSRIEKERDTRREEARKKYHQVHSQRRYPPGG